MPACDKVPPSQNNITRDVAVMSQLTNSIRLYGTDCNQTQMVIHAIERLELTDMKIWLGVWLDDNNSTNKRQIAQTWDILDQYGCDHFRGIIIGNEVLYRKDLTATELIDQITIFRQNITSHKCDLPVAMADLGDNWTADMASKVDIVMSNVHPFFAGVQADQAAAWTWDFWNSHDVSLTATNNNIKQVIAEVGWPSGGGTSCGGADTCTEGSVAGVDELNQFMEDWVCPSLKNQTEYFWFSAFDEPWKIQYNEPGKDWEDKWGLMTSTATSSRASRSRTAAALPCLLSTRSSPWQLRCFDVFDVQFSDASSSFLEEALTSLLSSLHESMTAWRSAAQYGDANKVPCFFLTCRVAFFRQPNLWRNLFQEYTSIGLGSRAFWGVSISDLSGFGASGVLTSQRHGARVAVEGGLRGCVWIEEKSSACSAGRFQSRGGAGG